MTAVRNMIRVLIVVFVFENIKCHDIYSDQDILRLQQIAANDVRLDTISGYNANLLQRDHSSQPLNTVNTQYQVTENDNKDGDYSRADRTRSRKVYRIKNPFQQQSDENEKPQESSPDTDTGASNQYGAVQYSLPPEQFLAQIRGENPYQQQQLSTQPSGVSYTVTPQPQYQYSTVAASGYESNQQPSFNLRTDPQTYNSNYNNANLYQYNNHLNSYNQDTGHSTPMPAYLSTSLPNNQYLGTPANSYVSSPSAVYLSSPQNLQQYVSSPVSMLQSGTIDYNNNRVTTTIDSNSLSHQNNDINKRMKIDHYDNSANGIRFLSNGQNQYQADYSSSTISPSTISYLDTKHDSWQNALNADLNTLSKTLQENQAQYQNLRYNTNSHENRQDTNIDTTNSDTHRIGSMPAANNLFFNFAKPDYQVLANLKSRSKNYEQEASQAETYSHGDYGWKLSDKKSAYSPEVSTTASNYRYQLQNLQPNTGAFSQVSFQIDTGKEYGYEQTPRIMPEKLDADEFARAAAKAHENYKQQLKAVSYASDSQYNNLFNNYPSSNSYFINSNKQRPTYGDNSSNDVYGNLQPEMVTASPFFYPSSRENVFENKPKSPFDHDKALKNIIPLDVSNVIQNTDNQLKINGGSEIVNKLNTNFGREQNDANQYSSQSNDAYFKDKNLMYFNVKPKSEEMSTPDRYKQLDSYYGKQQSFDSLYNYPSFSGNKRFVDETSQRNANVNQVLNNHQDNIQSSANIPHQSLRPSMSSDLSNYLKFNDIPHRFSEAYTADSLRLNNNNFDQGVIPTPLPLRVNQNVDNHHLDVATEILNKLMTNKQGTLNRPDSEPQTGGFISSINGMKVANPYNMDLKLVAEMLKGKPVVDDSQISHLRDQYTKPLPFKFDISQLQQLLHMKNDNNIIPINNALGTFSNSYFDIYNSGRSPYQGVKYSRSEEEAENIPIADSSNNHPIGAVIEEDDTINLSEESDEINSQDENVTSNSDEERPNNAFINQQRASENRHKQPNSIFSNRHPYKKKYPKAEVDEPYPVLKPPPPISRHRGPQGKPNKNRHRRNKPRILRIFKTEPLFEANALIDDFQLPHNVQSHSQLAEAKSSRVVEESL